LPVIRIRMSMSVDRSLRSTRSLRQTSGIVLKRFADQREQERAGTQLRVVGTPARGAATAERAGRAKKPPAEDSAASPGRSRQSRYRVNTLASRRPLAVGLTPGRDQTWTPGWRKWQNCSMHSAAARPPNPGTSRTSRGPRRSQGGTPGSIRYHRREAGGRQWCSWPAWPRCLPDDLFPWPPPACTVPEKDQEGDPGRGG